MDIQTIETALAILILVIGSALTILYIIIIGRLIAENPKENWLLLVVLAIILLPLVLPMYQSIDYLWIPAHDPNWLDKLIEYQGEYQTDCYL
jgi:hypothetical protein